MTKYQYFLQMFMLLLSRSKIATIQKVLLGAKKSQQEVDFEKASVQGKQVQMVDHRCGP